MVTLPVINTNSISLPSPDKRPAYRNSGGIYITYMCVNFTSRGYQYHTVFVTDHLHPESCPIIICDLIVLGYQHTQWPEIFTQVHQDTGILCYYVLSDAIVAWRIKYFTFIVCKEMLLPSDVIWRQGSGSTLAQVMACCLTAPCHYLNQCWLIISKVQWYSSEGSLPNGTTAISNQN